jgi:hypothetical protein
MVGFSFFAFSRFAQVLVSLFGCFWHTRKILLSGFVLHFIAKLVFFGFLWIFTGFSHGWLWFFAFL